MGGYYYYPDYSHIGYPTSGVELGTEGGPSLTQKDLSSLWRTSQDSVLKRYSGEKSASVGMPGKQTRRASWRRKSCSPRM